MERDLDKGGATNLKVGGRGRYIGTWEVNTVKTLKFEEGGGAWPSSSYGDTAPGPIEPRQYLVLRKFSEGLRLP